MSVLLSHHKQHTFQKLGFVIENTTSEHHQVQCLGVFTEKPPKGVILHNMFGETLFDNNMLDQLMMYIQAVGHICIKSFRINSDNPNQTNKQFHIQEYFSNGFVNYFVIDPNNYFDPNSYSVLTVNIIHDWIFKYTTSFVNWIEPHTSIGFMFFSKSEIAGYSDFEKKVSDKYSDYSDKKKKTLRRLIS